MAKAEREGKRPPSPMESFVIHIPADLKQDLIKALEDCGWEPKRTKRGVRHDDPVDEPLRELLRRAGFG